MSNIIRFSDRGYDANESGGRLILNNNIEGKPLYEIEGHISTERAVFLMQTVIKQILDNEDL